MRRYPILLFFCWDFGTWLDVEVEWRGIGKHRERIVGMSWLEERITTKTNKQNQSAIDFRARVTCHEWFSKRWRKVAGI